MPDIHPSAVVSADATIAVGASIGPFCLIEGPAVIEEGVRLLGHVTVSGHTRVGAGTMVHPNAVLGGPAQSRGLADGDLRLEIGADCVIREGVTMSRGTPKGGGVTRVGAGGYFMAYAHVGHDCDVGAGVTFANSATLAGHVSVGEGVWMGGLSAVHQFTRIGRFAMVGGMTGLIDDLIPYGMAVGDRARLEGLNLVGLKRRGVARDAIHALRRIHRVLADGSRLFAERLDEIDTLGRAHEEAGEVARFLRAPSKRSFCLP